MNLDSIVTMVILLVTIRGAANIDKSHLRRLGLVPVRWCQESIHQLGIAHHHISSRNQGL